MPDLLEQFEDDSPATDTRPFQDWDKMLENGETVLWEGFEELPPPQRNYTKLVNALAIILLFAGCLIGFFISPAGFLICILGFLMIKLTKTEFLDEDTIYAYAISNRHTFVHERNARDRRMRISLSRINEILVEEGPPDQVYFGTKTGGGSSAEFPTKGGERFGGVVSPINSPRELNKLSKTRVGFYNVANGHAVAKILAQAKENAK